MGFVKSINRAIAEIDKSFSPKHVLLLNSDTELTEGCLEEMVRVIEHSDRHGAVSPRSKNASIQTFPNGKQIDSKMSYNSWKKNMHESPEYHIIPTCVGF